MGAKRALGFLERESYPSNGLLIEMRNINARVVPSQLNHAIMRSLAWYASTSCRSDNNPRLDADDFGGPIDGGKALFDTSETTEEVGGSPVEVCIFWKSAIFFETEDRSKINAGFSE